MAGCSLDGDGGPGMYEGGPFAGGDRGPVPVSVESFHALKHRAADTSDGSGSSRVNLLNWDGGEVPSGMFPEEQSKR
jgi:nitrate reductase beta subunit